MYKSENGLKIYRKLPQPNYIHYYNSFKTPNWKWQNNKNWGVGTCIRGSSEKILTWLELNKKFRGDIKKCPPTLFTWKLGHIICNKRMNQWALFKYFPTTISFYVIMITWKIRSLRWCNIVYKMNFESRHFQLLRNWNKM